MSTSDDAGRAAMGSTTPPGSPSARGPPPAPTSQKIPKVVTAAHAATVLELLNFFKIEVPSELASGDVCIELNLGKFITAVMRSAHKTSPLRDALKNVTGDRLMHALRTKDLEFSDARYADLADKLAAATHTGVRVYVRTGTQQSQTIVTGVRLKGRKPWILQDPDDEGADEVVSRTEVSPCGRSPPQPKRQGVVGGGGAAEAARRQHHCSSRC